ncbi:MAG: VWA domain-containing protein [Saprospiraceae bacterium]|nr:VWA domain-containing protein [Saprospiraceae bacterium]
MIQNVIIYADKITFQNIDLEQATQTLETVEIVEYSVPLISYDCASYQVIKSKEIQSMPGVRANRAQRRNNKNQSVVTGGVYSNSGEMGSVRGARTSGTVYYDDGVEVEHNTESYDNIVENEFMDVMGNPLSTFSVDVDKASYSNVRRYLNNNQMPPKDAVRIEEFVNYFHYDYPAPEGEHPFSINLEAAICPWNPKHQIIQIGLKGKEISSEEIPPSNLVFLLDVSGSMSSYNKLPLLQKSMKFLVDKLRKEDKVAIVVYAGAAGCVLESTSGANKEKIYDAIDRLQAGGSTAGGAGIELAYKIAKENYLKEGNNRVILATDGDFNVGVSDNGSLVKMIEKKREDGVFLTILGFGMGNYKDNRMEQLSNAGNGNYAYIDNILEAQKMFGTELWGTLYTIAKDVKIQIEFNPAKVKAYRLIGYENRMLAAEDFNDDKKDAGEIGVGHCVTALYEIIPADSKEEARKTDSLKYQSNKIIQSDELLTVKFRYKEPDGTKSKLITKSISTEDISSEITSENLLFSSSVAEFGLLLRDSKFKENATYTAVLKRAGKASKEDPYGYRAEFIQLVKIAKALN